MKCLNVALVGLLVSFLSGCLWICRIPTAKNKQFSDDGVCTNAVYESMITTIRNNENTNLYCSIKGVYPLTKMRVDCTHEAWKGIDLTGFKGEELYNAKWANRTMPIASIFLWIGEPLDLVVDTIMIPWDL